MLPPHLHSVLDQLRRAFPHGVPAPDYDALLVVLGDDMSEGTLADVVSELVGRPPVVVENDAAGIGSQRPPPDRADVERVRRTLVDNGWARGEES